MSARRIKITDYDVAGITNEVNRWQSNGKYASYDISRRDDGVALLTLENVLSPFSNYFTYEIYKLGVPKLLRIKKFWIIQLYSSDFPEGPFDKHGCIAAGMLAKAITEAQKDVQFDFLSVMDFELAVSAMSE